MLDKPKLDQMISSLRGYVQMARFRNRLVHLYWEVDDARVQQYLKESLGDLDRFARAVATREWG